MFKLVLLFLTLSGLHAVPLALPRRLQKTSSTYQLPDDFRQGTEHSDLRLPPPDGFRQGTEASRRFIVDLNTGLVREHISEMERRADFVRTSLGNREMERRHWLKDEVSVEVPAERNGDGWVRVEAHSAPRLPAGFKQGTEPSMSIRDGFKQGTEPRVSIRDGFRQGTEPFMPIRDGFRQGTEPFMSLRDGFKQGTEPFMSLRDGFKQGTEPFMSLRDGFKQGTEPFMSLRDGFKQGTEPFMSLRDGFKQGTEPFMPIRDGFKQGTEPFMPIRDGFKQGTEPFPSFRDGFKQGTEPSLSLPNGFRQGTEPNVQKRQTQTVACKGEVINGNCYEFNPTPLAFEKAQALCRALAPNAELASVPSGDLHSRLVSLVTKGGKSNPVLTWLGGMVKNQQAAWVDGSEWNYSDWMPGHPNIHTDKPVCVEMFQIDESWWTATDCELQRASICSYPLTA